MSSIEKTADMIVLRAIQLQATDIHLTPRRHDYLIQLRLQGSLIPHRSIANKIAARFISHYKFLASMDISEKRKPQSGSMQIHIDSVAASLRISTLPTALQKESLVIRILPQKASVAADRMNLFPATSKKLAALLLHSHGLIILTGPTGSGKTTTMYTLVEHCTAITGRSVITLEDPVERKNDSLLQVQVNEKAGITYTAGLKAILRHDPDIIIVGEIRDAETARIAVRAALTGHLVLTTLHARDAKGAIYRLLEFGISRSEIDQTLIAATAQRLVHMVCPLCGPRCLPYCSRRSHPKRLGVTELLSGSALKKALKEADGEHVSFRYVTLKDLVRKGVALGYLSSEEYSRWILEQEQDDGPERAGPVF